MAEERDPVPLYTAEPGDNDIVGAEAEEQFTRRNAALQFPIKEWPPIFPRDEAYRDATQTARDVVSKYFDAIKSQSTEIVNEMLTANLVTTETRDMLGRTPFIVAAETGSSRMCLLFADFDADVNALGRFEGEFRTPLMVAAQTGSLTLVKLFVDVLHADDAKLAPDGQLALRLAVEAGHQEIVEFLPVRRNGGWQRWKHHHAKAVARSKNAIRSVWHFFKFLGWTIPKFLLWDMPWHCVIKPLKTEVEWAWDNKGRFPGWCRRQVDELPGRCKRAAKWMQKKSVEGRQRLKKSLLEDLPKFFTETLPKYCRRMGIWLRTIITVKIPAAIRACVFWIWDGIKLAGTTIADLIQKLASLIHTAIEATISFFQNIKLADIWNGFCAVLRSIFITFPTHLVTWIEKFFKMVGTGLLFFTGGLGYLIYYIIQGIIVLVLYVPSKFAEVVLSFLGSFGKGLHEIGVWLDPKGGKGGKQR